MITPYHVQRANYKIGHTYFIRQTNFRGINFHNSCYVREIHEI